MKQYAPRPGIVRTKICGVHVLIPSREAYDHCQTILPLSYIGAGTWKGLTLGKSLDEIVRYHQILTKQPEEVILERLEAFYEDLCNKGFLIEVPEEAEKVPTEGEIRSEGTRDEGV